MADQKLDVQQDSDRIEPELTPDRIRVRIGTARLHSAQVTNDQASAFQSLTGVYEPSAIQQLPDGTLLHRGRGRKAMENLRQRREE